MAGLTSLGFEAKTVEDTLAEIAAAQKATIAATLNTEADSVLGQINGIVAGQLTELWEAALALYSSQYPQGAFGFSLDLLCQLTGVTRLSARQSTTTLTLSGTPGTVIPIASIVSTGTGGFRFTTDSGATIGGGGTATVEATAVDFGPTVANAATITTIVTPVSGWASVTNPADAVLGRDLETDTALRLRRQTSLFAGGNSTLGAIQSLVSAVSGVTDTAAFENVSLVTDASLLPGKSIEIVVLGGVSAAIAAAIHASKPAGIATFGNTSVVVTDIGGSHTIYFSRPSDVAVTLVVDVTVDSTFPTDGVARIKTALADSIDLLGIGEDVIRSRLYDEVFSIPGVVDVVTLTITGGTPNLAIAPKEKAQGDTSTITVTTSLA